MTLHRRAAKRDATEGPIVDALVAAGCLVERISGAGVPDLLVWSPWRSAVVLLEVKGEHAKTHKKTLTDAQVAFHRRWISAGALVHVVKSVDQALAAVRAG